MKEMQLNTGKIELSAIELSTIKGGDDFIDFWNVCDQQ